jgi:xylulokinase
MPSHVLGIDVGTGGTRALVMDADGRIVASATEDHEAFASPAIGWAEQPPDDWWRAAALTIRRVLEQAKLPAREIACIGLSGQMHGAVVLDRDDDVVRPAIIWCDVRTGEQCEELAGCVGGDRIIQCTCNPPLPNFTLTRLLWMQRHEPRLWDRVRAVMLPKDYVRFRLTGERATDVADASGTLMLDVSRRRWSDEMLHAAGIDRAILPALHESTDVCARISAAGAEASGLAVGTPVVAGAGDQAAAAIAMGVVSPGAVSATIGTSGVVFAATDRPAVDPRGRLHTFCHAVPGRWHVMGVTQAAGLSLRWFRDRFTRDTDGYPTSYDQLIAEAETVPPGSDGLIWAPYLMGERTPHLDPHARGGLVGLTVSHTRGHVVRAILEGVGYSLKDTLTILAEMNVPMTIVRLGGGGARSPLWRQIQADVYGREVETVAAEEGAAYGAAILAGTAAGVWASVDEASRAVVRVSKRVQPDVGRTMTMNAGYAAYQRLYPALTSVFTD